MSDTEPDDSTSCWACGSTEFVSDAQRPPTLPTCMNCGVLQPHCPTCGEEFAAPSPAEIADHCRSNPDAPEADHITVRERGEMRLRDCLECHRTAALNSGEPIRHADDCPHASSRPDASALIDWAEQLREQSIDLRDDADDSETIAHFQGSINTAQAILEYADGRRFELEEWLPPSERDDA